MPQARDEAGNIWETDTQGNAVRLISAAGGSPIGGIVTKAADPTRPASIAKTTNEAAASVYDPQKAANNVAQGNYDLRTQPTKDNIALTGDLAKRYSSDPAIKNYTTAIQSYARALGTKSNTPQGDLSLIYSFAKIMDPDSVVREGEAASVSNSDTIAGQIVARYKKELGEGGTFSPEARQNLLTEMRNAMGALNASYVQARQSYGEIAKQNGLDEKQVIGPHAGLPFSKQDAKFTGTSEAKRDFYGNVVEPGRPILSPVGASGGIPRSTLPPSEGRRVIDPTGANEYSTERDRQFAAVAQAAFNNGATREQMDAIASAYGAQPFGEDLDQAIEGRGRGARTQFSTPTTGRDEASLRGRLAAGPVGGVAVGALNGLTIGGLDEIGAVGQRLIGGVPYSVALADLNARKRVIQDANPWSYNIANIGGAIGSGVGLGALGVGTRLPVLTDIAMGAGGGALEQNDNRLAGGVFGGAIGGATGGILRGLVGAPGRPVGPDLTIAQNVERAGEDAVRNRMIQARNLGVPMALADADPTLTALAGSATRMSPIAEREAITNLMPRGRGQVDRFGQAIERDLGPLANPMEQSEALLQQARRDAAPLYERANSVPVIGSPVIDDALATPFGREAIAKARTIAANDRRSPEAMGFRLNEDGSVALEPTIPMTLTSAGREGGVPVQQMGYTQQALDQAKQGMDDVLEQFRNPVTGKLELTPLGRSQNGVRADFLNELDAINPAYAEARRAYQGPMELRDALASGREAVRQTPREVQAMTARMSPPELNQAQLGYRVGLNDRANDMRYSANPFEGILGTPAAEQRLSAVYGDSNPGVARLLQQRDLERDLAGSSNSILGNSKTAQRIAADENFMSSIPGGIMDVGADLAVGNIPLGSALRSIGARALRDRARLGTLRNASQQAEQMAPTLFNTDTPAAIDALDELLARTSAYRGRQRLAQPIAGTVGGVIGGLVPSTFLGY